ncbi:MAG: hypothetical protein K2M76_00405 [Muribaculaceae bacterium]|nr:hypothetical protein [Muribaculaceae bacterium]
MNAVGGAEYCERVADSYCDVNPDSAAMWLRRGEQLAHECGDRSAYTRMHMKLLSEYIMLGLPKASLDGWSELDPEDMSEDLRLLYYEIGSRMLGYSAWCTSLPELRAEYIRKSMALCNALGNTDAEQIDSRHHFHKGLHAFYRGDVTDMLEHSRYIMEHQDMSDRYVSDMAVINGTYYLHRDNKPRAAYYFLVAAISDMTAGRIQSPAIEELCGLFYEIGDVTRATVCMKTAMENAGFTGSNIRIMNVMRNMESVMDASQAITEGKLQRQRMLGMVLICVVCVLAVLCVVLLMRMRVMHRRDAGTDLSPRDNDIFLARFLELGSMNMEKLGEFQRMALRKLNMSQYAELSDIIKSGKYLDEQAAQFYGVFDECVRQVYPHFVDDLNSLLRDDARVQTPTDGKLTAELRIMALIRMGIDDSSQIARYLGLSVNTVYTYRNRMRGRAVNRDTFDHEVVQIGLAGASINTAMG